jgi:hypothetical protein
MRKFTLSRLLLPVCFIIAGATACKKDDPATLIPPPIPDQSFVEEFDTVASAYHRGWVPVNNSNPKGSGIWVQGGSPQPYFEPYSSKGTYPGFIAADYLSTSADAAVVSNWLISPPVYMRNGDKIIFYTRTLLFYDASLDDSTDYGNGLEVCINRKNDGTNVGTALDPRDPNFSTKTDRGDFESLLQINPPTYDAANDVFNYRFAYADPAFYDPLAFPSRWTRFEVTVAGLDNYHKGRFAFRYYTLDAGSNGNGSAVGIDSVAFVSKH